MMAHIFFGIWTRDVEFEMTCSGQNAYSGIIVYILQKCGLSLKKGSLSYLNGRVGHIFCMVVKSYSDDEDYFSSFVHDMFCCVYASLISFVSFYNVHHDRVAMFAL